MPKISLTLPHNLGAEEAQRRVRQLAGETREEFGRMISDLEETWEGNVGTIRFRAMGFSVNGTIEAQADVVTIQLRIPLAALPLRSRIESEILKHGKAALA